MSGHRREVQAGRQGDREAWPVADRPEQGGGGPCWGSPHRHMCTRRHAPGDREEHVRKPGPDSSPLVPTLTPHLLGLGRGLGREAGAGTFRDPAVSVMRVHQLWR